MNLLEKHRDDYKKLKKKDLWKIIEEQLDKNRKYIDSRVYNPLKSKRNNNRRALRKYWQERHTNPVAKAKVQEKLAILKQIRDSGGL